MDTSRFLADAPDVEHPLDPSLRGIASSFPVRDFTLQGLAIRNAPVQPSKQDSAISRGPSFSQVEILRPSK